MPGSQHPTSIAGTTVSARLALAKYDNDGRGVRGAAVGRVSTGSLFPSGLAVSGSGVIYWSAELQGSAAFGGSNFSATNGMVLGKCDGDGNVIWAKLFDAGTYFPGKIVFDVEAVDREENLFVAG